METVETPITRSRNHSSHVPKVHFNHEERKLCNVSVVYPQHTKKAKEVTCTVCLKRMARRRNSEAAKFID